MSQPIQAQQITISVSKLAVYDEAEVTKFWDYCAPRLRYRFLLSCSSTGITREDAEDLTSQTIVAVYKKLGGFGNKTFRDLLSYVFATAYNLVRKYKKNNQRKRNLLARISTNASCATLADPSKHIVERIAAEKALLKLSERDGEVVYLMYIEGRSIKETALIMRLTEDNVKQIGSRAKKELAAEFSKQLTTK